MKKYLNNLKIESDKLQMTAAEKQAIRARVMHAVGATASPMFIQKTPYFGWFVGPRAFVPALALLLVVGVSTASAAQGSLPGDLLYPVKISITEQVETALAVGLEAKAQIHADLATRRLEEAQSLAVAGKLDTISAETLEANFNVHAEVAEVLSAQIEPENPAAATEIKTKLATAVTTQGAILVQLGDESSSEVTKQNSRAVAARLVARGDNNFSLARGAAANMIAFSDSSAKQTSENSVSTLAIAVEPPVAAKATLVIDPVQQKTTAELQEKAAKLLATAREQLKNSSANLDATTTASVEAQFSNADLLMSSGSSKLKEGDTFGASADFTAALQIASKVYTVLKAQQKFESNIITPLLNFNVQTEPAIEITLPAVGPPVNLKIN
jgi:hypothetical protein